MPDFTDLLSSLTPSCPGVRPAPVLRLQRDAGRGAARRGGARHGRRHPRRLLPAPDPQEAPQRGRQQPKVIPIYFYRVFLFNFLGSQCLRVFSSPQFYAFNFQYTNKQQKWPGH